MDCGVLPFSAPMICNRPPIARSSLCYARHLFLRFVPKRFFSAAASSHSRSFGWDDVVSVATENVEEHDPSDLRGYLDKVRICNRGSEKQSEFVPFMVEDQIAGFIHKGFISHLSKFKDVFSFVLGNDDSCAGAFVTLHPSLRTADDRSWAVGNVIKYLGSLIPGIRDEIHNVELLTFDLTGPDAMAIVVPQCSIPCQTILWNAHFILIRACSCSLLRHKGIWTEDAVCFAWQNSRLSLNEDKTTMWSYGVHMNGYVERQGQKFLWVGKRSNVKPTYPGMLDHLVAGGLPHGITCQGNLMKECEEEAGIPCSISNGAIPVGAVSYMDIDGHSYKRDVLFCYDLKLPEGFIPQNKDGEVDSFRLIPIEHVANIVRRTEFFKPNCSLVIIDFLFRHGYISPNACGYLELLQSLRSGDCS